MQMDKLTTLVRNAVMAAQNDALARNHQKLTAMHVLTALLADDNVTLRSLVGACRGRYRRAAGRFGQGACRHSLGDRIRR